MHHSRSIALAFSAGILLTACGGGDSDSGSGAAGDAGEEALAAASAGMCEAADLERFAGARVKMAWVQQQKSGQIDQYAVGRNLRLMVLDSAAGSSVRSLLDKVGSYSRPLITPDGERVVFSDKGRTKSKSGLRKYRPRCYVIDFDGSRLVELGEGYAELVWRDPADGTIWVYVGVGYKDANNVIMEGARLERFKIDAPAEREVVWDKTGIGSDGFRVSRDGSRLAGLFPWPDGGLADLKRGTLLRTGNGCWTSMAPDDSGVSWVFDGAHRNVTIYTSEGSEIGTVALNGHPDLKGHKVYHPRWTNHPRYVVVTGPFLENKKKGTDEIEVYIARMSEDLRSLEATQKVTENERADLYPDVWIEGAESVSLGVIGAGSKPPEVAADGWPLADSGVMFAWRNSRRNVEVGGEICRVRAVGAARYGRRFGMAPGKGSFVVDSLASERFPAGTGFAFEAVITPAGSDGPIAQIGSYVLEQLDGEFQFSQSSGQGGLFGRFGELEPDKPVHVAIRFGAGFVDAIVNGMPAGLQVGNLDKLRERPMAGLRFGGGWDGQIERVALYRDASPESLNASAASADLEHVPVAGRVKIRAKLVETTPLPSPNELGAYTRALVYFLYEVEDALQVEDELHGALASPKVVVGHWSLLDREPAAGLPLRIGEQVVLEIDPLGEHPELKSERTFNAISDFDAPVYFDIRTPEILNDEQEAKSE